MKTSGKPERLVGGLGFGESPRWHDGKLWLSDMQRSELLMVSLDGKIESAIPVPGTPSGIGWLPDGTLLVVSMDQKSVLSYDGSGFDVYADLTGLVGGACNELVVDGEGRAFVGNVGFDHHVLPFQPKETRLVLIPQGEDPRQVGESVLVPNGSVVTPDGSTLILAETLSNRLSSFEIDPDGSLHGRSTFAEMPGRLPDGICLDAEGCVWIADSGSTSCVRVRRGGECVEEIDAGRPCFACMLGGPEGTTLFIVTADGYDDESKARATGAVEFATVSVPAAGWP